VRRAIGAVALLLLCGGCGLDAEVRLRDDVPPAALEWPELRVSQPVVEAAGWRFPFRGSAIWIDDRTLLTARHVVEDIDFDRPIALGDAAWDVAMNWHVQAEVMATGVGAMPGRGDWALLTLDEDIPPPLAPTTTLHFDLDGAPPPGADVVLVSSRHVLAGTVSHRRPWFSDRRLCYVDHPMIRWAGDGEGMSGGPLLVEHDGTWRATGVVVGGAPGQLICILFRDIEPLQRHLRERDSVRAAYDAPGWPTTNNAPPRTSAASPATLPTR
jgi:hypothetical protein